MAQNSFRQYLNTDFIPSQQQGQHITKICDELRSNIIDLDRQIADLVRTRQGLSEDLAAYQALIFPARNLPQDIIREIFAHCMPSDPQHASCSLNDWRSGSEHMLPISIRLSNVCRWWRSVALQAPELWSCFTISPLPRCPKHSSDVVRMWLNRSGTMPLHIVILGSEHMPDFFTDTFSQISLHLKRWCSFRLLNVQISLISAFHVLCSDDVPLLRSVHIALKSPRTRGHSQPWHNELSFLNAAPALHSVFLNPPYGSTGLPTLPWHQLTRLNTDSPFEPLINEDALVDILSQCTRLEHFSFDSPVFEMGHIATPVLLAHLVSLNIINPVTEGVATVLDILKTPNLKEISVSAESDIEAESWLR